MTLERVMEIALAEASVVDDSVATNPYYEFNNCTLLAFAARIREETLRDAPTLDEVAQVVGNLLTAHKVNPMQRRIDTAHSVRLFLREKFPNWSLIEKKP